MADVQHGHGTLTKLLFDDPLDAQLRAPLKQLDAIMSSVDTTSARLKEFQDALDLATTEFHALQAELKAGKGSLAKVDQLQARFDELTVKIDGMMARINSGQGTIGQLHGEPATQRSAGRNHARVSGTGQGPEVEPEKVRLHPGVLSSAELFLHWLVIVIVARLPAASQVYWMVLPSLNDA